MHVRALLGISTTVGDLRRAEVFYREAFGFVAGNETISDDPTRAQALQLPAGAKTHNLRMALGAQEIELVCFDPPGRAYPQKRAANDLWFHHIAIVVDDMTHAFARLPSLCASLISNGGPQRLPANTGGVTAAKFRDPDGHPLELLHFPRGVGDAVWHRWTDRDPRGYDHSAIVVANIERSLAFYTELFGFHVIGRTLNQGVEQDRLDGLSHCLVDVVGLAPADVPTPHLELLSYRQPAGATLSADIAANDIASTRLMLQVDDLDGIVGRLQQARVSFVSPGIVSLETGVRIATIRDPDRHMIMLMS